MYASTSGRTATAATATACHTDSMRGLGSWLVGGLAVMGTACATASDPRDKASGGCGPITREALDASSPVHLLPGAPEPDYLTDPPTSGPHLSGRPPEGAVAEPLDRPTQVLILEEGGVLIQHRGLDESDVAGLATLAGENVVVAPNAELPAPVVATAWLAKRTCDGLDVEALGQFIDENLGRGPEGGEAGEAEPG